MKPAEKGFSMIVEYLLENNADPNIADQVRLIRMSQSCQGIVIHMEQSIAQSAEVIREFGGILFKKITSGTF